MGAGFTSACDLHCRFCYSARLRGACEADLPPGTWRRFFAANHERIAAVNYGTGESTLVDGWYELITEVRRRWPHIPQAVTTNGRLAAALRRPDHLAAVAAAIDEVDVSLDFADAARHDAMRGASGTHELALAAMSRSVELGKTTTLVLLGIDETLALDNLARLFVLAAARGALVRINLYRPFPGQPFRPPRPQVVFTALDWITARYRVLAMSDPLLAALYGYARAGAADPSGRGSLRILPGGEITPSTYLTAPEWVAGSIADEGILDRLAVTAPFLRLATAPLPHECRDCQLREACGGGPLDRRILTEGSAAAPDPYCPGRTGVWPRPPAGGLRLTAEARHVHAGYLPTLIFAADEGAA